MSSSHRSNRLREDRERLSLLQSRDLSPADYHELLSLDNNATLAAPPLHEHLMNALPTVLTSSECGQQKCVHCTISLKIDRDAKQFPCSGQHIVHSTCAMSILFSALSTSECEGSACVGGIVCPFCPCGATSTLIFPALRREPVQAKKIDASKSKPLPPSDVTNLRNSASAGNRDVHVGAIKLCQLSITGLTATNKHEKGTKCADQHTQKRQSAIK